MRSKKAFNRIIKPTILLLVFLMVLAPVFNALAEETEQIADSEPAVQSAQDSAAEQPAAKAEETAENNQIQAEPEIKADAKPANQTASLGPALPSTGEIKKQALEHGFCKNCDLKQADGSLNYSYDLELPAGRNGLTPKVSLSYSQFNRDISSIVGLGWDLISGPYIERSSRLGADKIYSTNEFKLYSNGAALKLLPVNLTDNAHGSYAAKIDESFSFYEYLKDDSWLMTDVKGVKYYLGQSASSRQDDPANPAKIYRWHVEKIEDTNGNVINYSYFKDKGRVYPKEISYANTPDRPAGVYVVRFEPFASGGLTERPDKNLSFATGFRVQTDYRLEKIAVGIYESENFSAKKEYRLDYVSRPGAKIYSLAGLTEAGGNGADWELKPKIEFGYDAVSNNWAEDTQTRWNWPPELGGEVGWYMSGDINNDGLTDTIIFKKDYSSEVYLNSGLDGYHKADGAWQIPSEINWRSITVVNPPSQKTALVDLNGDQLDDLIIYDLNKNTFHVYLHNGVNGWNFNAGPWENPDLIFGSSAMDANNDGYADYVKNIGDSIWQAYLYNGRNGWSKSDGAGWQFPGSAADLMGADINNDGLPDLIRKTSDEILIQGDWKFGQEVYLYNNQDGFKRVYTNYSSEPANDFNWSIPDAISYAGCLTYGLDLNNDRLADYLILPKYGEGSNCRYAGTYLNNGLNGWEKADASSPPAYRGEIGGGDDLNNDGWPDYRLTHDNSIWLNSGSNTFFLSSIKNNRGGEVKITYQNARSFRQDDGSLANPHLKWDKFAVKKIAYFDRGEAGQSEEFNYQGGEYILENAADPWSREFAGFYAITAKDKAGNYNIEYFHQGGGADGSAKGEYLDHFSKKGKPYRLEHYDKNGNLYALEINKFESAELGSGRYFSKLTSQVLAQYDGNADYRARAKEYNYDDYGNVKRETDTEKNNNFKGAEISYVYDTGENGLGRLSLVNFGQGAKQYYYDILGRTVREDLIGLMAQKFSTSYNYDFLGNILSVKYPDQSIVNYSYNGAGQISAVKIGGADVVNQADYEANGEIKNLTLANGVMTANTYEPAKLYRLTAKKTTKGQTILQDINYVYDPIGNITDITDNSATAAAKTAHYDYDDLYRLTEVKLTSSATSTAIDNQTYQYDILGNILSKSDAGNYSYGGNLGTNYANPDAVTAIGTSTYGYDQNGNLTKASGWQYGYDYNNRLIMATNGTIKVRYGYDYAGQRLYYTSGADTTIYANKYFNYKTSYKITMSRQQRCLPSRKCVIVSVPVITTTVKTVKQIYLHDLLIATIETENRQDKIYYVHTDHLTGSNVITDKNGKLAQTLDYHPFGAIRLDQRTGTFNEQKKFTGKELDRETGLYYFGARYYDGKAGS